MKIKSKKLIKDVMNQLKSDYDPNGSYTGCSEKGEKPVQDADDL